jgi:hypothetical protein
MPKQDEFYQEDN